MKYKMIDNKFTHRKFVRQALARYTSKQGDVIRHELTTPDDPYLKGLKSFVLYSPHWDTLRISYYKDHGYLWKGKVYPFIYIGVYEQARWPDET